MSGVFTATPLALALLLSKTMQRTKDRRHVVDDPIRLPAQRCIVDHRSVGMAPRWEMVVFSLSSCLLISSCTLASHWC